MIYLYYTRPRPVSTLRCPKGQKYVIIPIYERIPLVLVYTRIVEVVLLSFSGNFRRNLLTGKGLRNPDFFQKRACILGNRVYNSIRWVGVNAKDASHYQGL